jgi:hypothetical protein
MNNHQRKPGDTVLEKPPMERVIGAVGQGLLAQFVVTTIRTILNDSIRSVRPGQVVAAIRNDTSLWKEAGADVKSIAAKIPPSAIAAGKPMYQRAVQQYGSATELVLAWLKEDNAVLFSLIINTEGGVAWFDRQVREMTTNLGLEYE